MRGQFTLFSDMFESKATSPEPHRPRNYHLPTRNEHLAMRYYYYAEIKSLRYDRCLECLEKEFYLTEHRLIWVLTQMREYLEDMVKEKPSLSQLARKVPHLKW